ncbi:Uncharacterized protein SCF082_LOCUS28783, partial [Durusdinium trenchii]
VRFDLESVYDIDIQSTKFAAKFLVYVRVHFDELGISPEDRRPMPGKKHYLDYNGRRIQEWTPWLEVKGALTFKWSWVREERENNYLIHAYELDGTFPLGKNERGLYYPFDFHDLKMAISSNWDAEKLIFIPWDSEWGLTTARNMMNYKGGSVPIVDATISRARVPDLDASLKNKWRYEKVPRLTFSYTDGFSNRHKYSEVHATLYVERVALLHLANEMMRPLLLAVLAPLSLYFFETAQERLGYNSSILIAMSLAFLRTNAERTTLAEYYKLAMFLFSAIALVLATFEDIFSDFPRGTVEALMWIFFFGLNVIFIIFLLFLQPRRLSVKRKYEARLSTSVQAAADRVNKASKGSDDARVEACPRRAKAAREGTRVTFRVAVAHEDFRVTAINSGGGAGRKERGGAGGRGAAERERG